MSSRDATPLDRDQTIVWVRAIRAERSRAVAFQLSPPRPAGGSGLGLTGTTVRLSRMWSRSR
jgi:hypothetical protein